MAENELISTWIIMDSRLHGWDGLYFVLTIPFLAIAFVVLIVTILEFICIL